jgi:D-xylulose reductase
VVVLVVLVGMSVEPVRLGVVAAQADQTRIGSVFRYANVYDRAIAPIASGQVGPEVVRHEHVLPEESIMAFERVAKGDPADVKQQIRVAGSNP